MRIWSFLFIKANKQKHLVVLLVYQMDRTKWNFDWEVDRLSIKTGPKNNLITSQVGKSTESNDRTSFHHHSQNINSQ